MSWSISLLGKPENIVKALHEESATKTGQCKVEFDDALPHLVGLVSQNFQNDPAIVTPVLELIASGTGHSKDGQQIYRNCNVSLTAKHQRLV